MCALCSILVKRVTYEKVVEFSVIAHSCMQPHSVAVRRVSVAEVEKVCACVGRDISALNAFSWDL